MSHYFLSKARFFCSVALGVAVFAGCDGSSGLVAGSTPPATPEIPGVVSAPKFPAAPGDAKGRSFDTDVLLFAGNGSWSTEVLALEQILTAHAVSYRKINSAELDLLAFEDFARYGTMIFPGGSGGTEAGSLLKSTRLNVRRAVRELGVNYVGFCAGAWVAVAPEVGPANDAEYGFGIVAGPVLDYYHPLEDKGVTFDIVTHTFADGHTREIPWYGGPVTMGPEGVIAKYPNGQPAMSETWSGKGFVVLSATHPAAPQSIRDDFGVHDSDGLDLDVAWALLSAAMNQAPLPVFSVLK